MNAALFVGQSAANMRLPFYHVLGIYPSPATRFKKGRGQKEEEERSFTSIKMLHTHTPGQSRVNPERQEEEKSGHTKGKRPKTAQGGGGEQTDLRNQPTRRNGPEQNSAHT